jgi:O-antigen ligase
MIAYARRARVPLTEGLFLWFAFCTAAYTRDFSYVRWPGAPLFVTDVVLLILLLSIYVLRRSRNLRSPMPVNVLLLLFLGAGVLAAARGLWGHQEAILVFRDLALVVYALFLLVAYHLLRSWLSIKRAAVWLLLGAALGALNGLAWFIAVPAQRRFINYGIYILIALVGVLLAMVSRQIRPRLGWIFAGVLCLGLMLANARSLFVSLPILLFLGMLGRRSFCKRIHLGHLAGALVGAAALVTLASFLFLHTEAGRDFAERATEELASGVMHSGDDANWQFRVIAWKVAWRRFTEYPLAGEGFGVPFTFEIWGNDPRPHNTFLTVLYKMGLTGSLPLLALLVYLFWIDVRAVRHNLENRRVAFLLIVVLAQVAFCFYGVANLLLESPFIASLFWVVVGVGFRMVRMLEFERSFPKAITGYRYQKEVVETQTLAKAI